MDSIRAKSMECELRGRSIGGWTVQTILGAGKSAVVFEATNDVQKVALKIFDRELIERFGCTTQLGRIDRELELLERHHPNLVGILGGGECPDSGYLYVVMEFVDAPNLASTLDNISPDSIGPLIRQIASAAEYLEQLGLVHRDIKPENIAVDVQSTRAVLLDLGILRPFGDSNLTDDEAKVFIGTLRYSSPEFLVRNEGHTCEEWRAVTFYQLGAVLHDMIMKRPLFHEFSDPYPILVEAVKSQTPNVHSDVVSPDLVLLAQNCLVKDPIARLKLVSWENFQCDFQRTRRTDDVISRVRQRVLRAGIETDASERHLPSRRDVTSDVAKHFDDIVRLKCIGNVDFPRMQLIPNIVESKVNFDVALEASSSHALAHPLLVRFVCEIIDPSTSAVCVSVVAALLEQTSLLEGVPDSESVALFQGPLDSALLGDKVVAALYHALDIGQQQSLQTPEANLPCSLDLNSALEAL